MKAFLTGCCFALVCALSPHGFADWQYWVQLISLCGIVGIQYMELP